MFIAQHNIKVAILFHTGEYGIRFQNSENYYTNIEHFDSVFQLFNFHNCDNTSLPFIKCNFVIDFNT